MPTSPVIIRLRAVSKAKLQDIFLLHHRNRDSSTTRTIFCHPSAITTANNLSSLGFLFCLLDIKGTGFATNTVMFTSCLQHLSVEMQPDSGFVKTEERDVNHASIEM